MCPISDLVGRYWNGDSDQLRTIIHDPTRNPHAIALSLQRVEGGESITGEQVLAHRHRKCDCQYQP